MSVKTAGGLEELIPSSSLFLLSAEEHESLTKRDFSEERVVNMNQVIECLVFFELRFEAAAVRFKVLILQISVSLLLLSHSVNNHVFWMRDLVCFMWLLHNKSQSKYFIVKRQQ